MHLLHLVVLSIHSHINERYMIHMTAKTFKFLSLSLFLSFLLFFFFTIQISLTRHLQSIFF